MLTDLKHSPSKVASLRKRLARRFAVLDDQFRVLVNGTELSVEDRGYGNMLQYAWTLGARGKLAVSQSRAKVFDLESQVGNGAEAIDGWVGTVKRPGLLASDGESGNRIAVMVRGKMAQEDMLGEMGEHGVYSAYVVGEIYADFMDVDGEDDAATTGRQHLREDDPRYGKLKEKIGRVLKRIEGRWTELRNEEGVRQACESPPIKRWYDGLPANLQGPARSMLGRMNTLRVDTDDERRRLFLAGIIAFEGLRLNHMLDRLDSITVSPVNFDSVFEKIQELEATAYYQITRNRLDVIKKLNDFNDDNELERIVQNHLYENLWLLDPSWSYAPGTEVMEKTVSKKIEQADKDLGESVTKARLDIKYTTVAGKHVVIELKRPGRSVTTDAIEAQLKKYWRVLKREFHPGELEFVCVLSKRPDEWRDSDEAARAEKSLEGINARIVTYHELIERAEKAYAEYAQSKKRLSGLHDLVDSMKKEDRDTIGPG